MVQKTVITPFLTFPDISWWMQVCDAGTIIFDAGEHFEKMTSRNRYRISGANNSILLSVPLVNGRNQHVPMKDVQVYNEDKWQVQHWRTLVSVYRRTPFFEYYEPSLQPLFETEYAMLSQFNMAGILWAKKQLKMAFDIQETEVYIKQYPPDTLDLRPSSSYEHIAAPRYYQIFQDRIGFQPNLSILDLLFSEGPNSINLLKSKPLR